MTACSRLRVLRSPWPHSLAASWARACSLALRSPKHGEPRAAHLKQQPEASGSTCPPLFTDTDRFSPARTHTHTHTQIFQFALKTSISLLPQPRSHPAAGADPTPAPPLPVRSREAVPPSGLAAARAAPATARRLLPRPPAAGTGRGSRRGGAAGRRATSTAGRAAGEGVGLGARRALSAAVCLPSLPVRRSSCRCATPSPPPPPPRSLPRTARPR